MDFTKPQYDCLFRRNFEFEQYGSKEHFWIELDYYILRDSYATRVGRALDTNMLSAGGQPIFTGSVKEQIAAKNMVLINEDVAPVTRWQDIYKVTELYGYAPDETFYTYSGEVVQFPALRNTSTADVVEERVVLRYDLGQLIFVDSNKLFNVGDMLNFTLFQTSASNGLIIVYAAQASQLSQVVEIRVENDVRTCYCTDVSWYIPYNGATSGSQATITAYNTRSGMATRGFVTRKEFNALVLITNCISYHTTFPPVNDRLKIYAGNNEMQEIDSSTVPTFNQWQTMAKNGTLVCLMEPEITQVGSIYKKTLKKCQAR